MSLTSSVLLKLVVEKSLSWSTTQRYCQFAMLCLVVYDIIILLDKEIKYIWDWGNRNRLTGIAYLVIRYFAVIHTILAIWGLSPSSQHTCIITSWIAGLLGWAITSCIDYVLCKRVCAMYSFYQSMRNKWFRTTLKFLLVVQSCVSLGVLLASLASLNKSPVIATDFICTAMEPGIKRIIYWIMSPCFELLLVISAIVKIHELLKIPTLDFRGSSTRVAKQCVQEQILYVFFLVFCSISNILVFSPIFFTFTSASTLSLAGSRMVINLRERLDRSTDGSYDESTGVDLITFHGPIDTDSN